MQVSFDGTPVTLHLESRYVVAIDPLALDGLANELAELMTAEEAEQLGAAAGVGRLRSTYRSPDRRRPGRLPNRQRLL